MRIKEALAVITGGASGLGLAVARHVVAAEETATLPHLAELMVRHGVKRVPIVRGMKVVGIVSRSDIVAAIARAPAMLV